jgi:hypothetical protein
MIRGGIKILLLAVAIGVLGMGVQTVNAASSGLTISPTSFDVELKPGATYKGEMQVINQSELDYSYKVYATPYSVTGEDYQPYFSPIKDAVDITKWFTLGKTASDLKVGNQDTIPFTVTVPEGTGAGSYYATVFAETEDKGNMGVITRKRVGTIIYLRVSGDVIEKSKIQAWDVPWLQEAPLSGSLKVANEGSVHFSSKVKVTVSDLFGGPKYVHERDPKVLPQKVRNIPVIWENGATFGLFKVDGEVTSLGKTEKLPMKIVFVANWPMRLLTLALLLGFIGTVVFLGKKRAGRKK